MIRRKFLMCASVVMLATASCGKYDASSGSSVVEVQESAYKSSDILPETTTDAVAEGKNKETADITATSPETTTTSSGYGCFTGEAGEEVQDTTVEAENKVQSNDDTDAPIYSDDTMHDQNGNTAAAPTIEPVIDGDGDVLIIGSIFESMGKSPLRISTEESALIKELISTVEMQPCDEVDQMKIPIGGAMVIQIEGGTKYYFLGGDYIQIGDSCYYDSTGNSEKVIEAAANIIYDYYGPL